MGSWGPGIFQSDARLELYSVECLRLAEMISRGLAAEDAEFDDIEGTLVYVHILAILSQNHPPAGLARSRVEGWKSRHLTIYDESVNDGDALTPAQLLERAAIVSTFDSLTAALYE